MNSKTKKTLKEDLTKNTIILKKGVNKFYQTNENNKVKSNSVMDKKIPTTNSIPTTSSVSGATTNTLLDKKTISSNKIMKGKEKENINNSTYNNNKESIASLKK